jgi:hypothetical protein
MVTACCIMLPFVRTDMTEEYVNNEKVFGRWQSRMLEPHEAARGVTQLLARPPSETNLGNFKLRVIGPRDSVKLGWSQVRIDVNDALLSWSEDAQIVCGKGA